MEANGASQRPGAADPAAGAAANGGAHTPHPTLPPPPDAPRRPRAGWAPELTLGFTPLQLNVLRNQIMAYRSFKVRKEEGGFSCLCGDQAAPSIHSACVRVCVDVQCVWLRGVGARGG